MNAMKMTHVSAFPSHLNTFMTVRVMMGLGMMISIVGPLHIHLEWCWQAVSSTNRNIGEHQVHSHKSAFIIQTHCDKLVPSQRLFTVRAGFVGAHAVWAWNGQFILNSPLISRHCLTLIKFAKSCNRLRPNLSPSRTCAAKRNDKSRHKTGILGKRANELLRRV